MHVVIDIPDEAYKAIKNSTKPLYYVEHLIKEGTPLPKGHGRIVDIDKVLEEMRATKTYDIPFALERVKPIIKADAPKRRL